MHHQKVVPWLVTLVVLSIVDLTITVRSALAQEVSFVALTRATLPWDAVPSPEGSIVYFTAIAEEGFPAVLRVPAGGGPVTQVAAGGPLVMPLGITISTDGHTLYIADPWTAGSAGNALYAVAASAPEHEAEAVLVDGTQGTMPQGVTLVSQEDGDQLYFTGINPHNGHPVVYKIPAGGGQVTLLWAGKPLIAPSGIAVARDGTVYVLDRLASKNGLGAVVRIQEGATELLADNIRTGGQMAGVALNQEETALLVSSLEQDAGTAQVLVISLPTLETSIMNQGISESTGAGGLHRAHGENLFAWAGLIAGRTGGTVFVAQ